MAKATLNFLLLAILLSVSCAQAQVIIDTTKKTNPAESIERESDKKRSDKGSSDKCIKKFKSLTDTYYGFPTFFGYILQAAKSERGTTLSSIGPTGVKYEFLLTDKFGIGTDVNYSTAAISWDERKNDAAGNNTLYHYKFSSTAFRSMASFNFHVNTKKKADWYISLKGGYYGRTFKFASTEPGAVAPKLDHIWTSNDWHFAGRFEFGVRLFLTRFLALNFSYGMGGGPLLSSGVSSKF